MKQPRLVISLPVVESGEQPDGTWMLKVQVGPNHFATVEKCKSEQEAITMLLSMDAVSSRGYIRTRNF